MFVNAYGFNGFKQLKADENSLWNKFVISCGNSALDLAEKERCFYDHFCSWESLLFLKDQMIHVHGFCGCPIHSIHSVSISDVASFPKDEIVALVNAGNAFGALAKSGKFVIFEIICHQNEESKYHCSVSILYELEKSCYLAGSGCNLAKFLIVNEQGNLISLTRQIDTHSFCISSEIEFKEKIRQICCGNDHCLALTFNGKVFSWGIGSRGQLGHGDLMPRDRPELVEALEGVTIQKIACGGWHSVALADTKDLYTWGWNESGQTGFPALQNTTFSSSMEKRNSVGSTPPIANEVLKISDIKSKEDCVSLKREKDSFIGGCDYTDNLNNENVVDPVNMLLTPLLLELERYLPAKENDFVSITDVACGSRHTAALTSTGQALTWGWGKYGQLGQACCVLNDVINAAGAVTKPMCKHAAHLPSLVDLDHNSRVFIQQVSCGPWNTFLFSDNPT